jgi:hypothetical protein
MNRNELIKKAIEGLHALAELIETGMNSVKEPNSELSGIVVEAARPEEKQTTLEEVRGILALKAKDGMGAQVRMLLQLHGAQKLSEIAPGKFGMLARQGEKLETLDVITATLEKQKANGFEDAFPALFDHHYATGLADLDPNYYESFLSDAEELNHAG